MEMTLENFQEVQKNNDFLVKENETLKKLVKEYSLKVSESQELLSTYEGFIKVEQFPKVESLVNSHMAFVNKFGSYDEVSAKLESLEEYKALGEVEVLKEASELASEYMKIASLDEVKESIELLDSLADFGKVSEIKESLENYAEYKGLATPAEIKESVDMLREVADLGTVESIKYALESKKALNKLGYTVESVEDVLAQRAEDARNAKIDELVNGFNITREASISTLEMKDFDLDEAKAFLETLNLSKNSLIGRKVEKVTESISTTKTVKTEKKGFSGRTLLNKF